MLTRRDLLLGSAAGVAALNLLPGGAAAQTGAPQRGGVLRMLLNVEPPSLCSAVNSSLWIACLSTKMMEGLVAYDLDMKMRPLLAESWEFNPEGTVLRFNLRRNAKWHDGAPFTSADVKFSVEEVWKKLHPRARTTMAAVQTVDTPDAHTAVFRLSHPAPVIFSFLNSYEAQVVPKHVFGGGDILQNPALSAPVGTGPFMFKEWRKGQFVEMVRNPNYWDAGKPYLDGVIARMVADGGSRVAAFESGEVMYAPFNPAPTSDVARLRGNPNLVVETRGYDFFAPVQAMEINQRVKPLDDVRVRQAIRHAIDSNFVAENVWFGLAAPAMGMLQQASPFRATDLAPLNYDTGRANALLDEAGLKRPSARENRFSIRLLHGMTGENPRTAEYVRQAMARVGIEVKLESADLGTFIRRIYTDRDFDLTINTLFLSPDPYMGLQRIANPTQAIKGTPFGNAGGYENAAATAKWQEAGREPNLEKRRALFQEVQRLLWRDLPILYLVEQKFFTLHNRRFHGHTKQADSPYDTFADAWIAT